MKGISAKDITDGQGGVGTGQIDSIPETYNSQIIFFRYIDLCFHTLFLSTMVPYSGAVTTIMRAGNRNTTPISASLSLGGK